MSSNGGASQFTDSNCQGFGSSDIQLAKDVFAGSGTDPFVFECMLTRYTGPSSFPDCSIYLTTLCIGAHGQQHACVVGSGCHVVDWSGPHADSCSTTIMQFASVQNPGLNSLCCDSGFCSAADSKTSDPLSGPQLLCSNAGRQLWFCVNDGSSVECVNTRDQSICSGNFTTPTTVTGGSSPNPTRFSIPSQFTTPTSFTFPSGIPTSNNTPNSNAAENSSQTRTIIIAVVASVGGLLLLVFMWVLVRKRRRYQLVPVHPLVAAPPISPPATGSSFPNSGALTYQGYHPVQTSDYANSGYTTSTNSESSNMVMDSNLTSVAGNMSNYNNVTVNHYHPSQSS